MGNLEKNVEELVRLIQTLKENIPKGDDMAQGTHENKDRVHDEQTSVNKHIPRGFGSDNGGNGI